MGATEPHNYHLPYGTDSLETTRIAEISAEKAWFVEDVTTKIADYFVELAACKLEDLYERSE